MENNNETVNEIEIMKEGKWVKYEHGGNSYELWLSLQGYRTGWSIAKNENIARDQLANGDFYVYYSLDENEDAKVPRIAIAMNGTKEITEIRGIADDQNMEPEMLPILNKKLNEDDKFDKQKIDIYLKRVHDMELLTLIDKKTSYGQELSVDEIRFLYEMDSEILGFGYKEDPRIYEIRQKRNKVKDYNLVFKYNKEFNGNLNLADFTSVEGLDLAGVNIRGDLVLSGLTRTKGLNLSEVNIGGDLDLSGLTKAKVLDLSGANIGGHLFLYSLTSVECLDLSGANIGEYVNLGGLTSAKVLDLSGANIDSLNLGGLTSVKCLDLSGANIGEFVNLSGLTSAKGLDLSGANIGEYVNLSGLTSTKGLDLSGPNIGIYVDLSGLTSTEGLDLSGAHIGRALILRGLTSTEGLMLPYYFDVYNLICNDDIKEEIKNNHDKYFAKPPIEKEDEIKNQNFDIKSEGLDSTGKVRNEFLSNENSQEEKLNEAAAQKFNDETEALVINGNGDKKVAYVKKYDGTVEKIPYSKNMDKFIGEQKAAKERGKFSRFFEISSDPEVAKGQVEALEEIINRNNNLDSADNSKQSDGNVVDESMNVHRTR